MARTGFFSLLKHGRENLLRSRRSCSTRYTIRPRKKLVMSNNHTMPVCQEPEESIRPILTEDYARKIVKSVFGLNVKTIKELPSYYDRNFHVEVDEQRVDNPYIKRIRPAGYVLKVINYVDSRKSHYEGEHRAMEILDNNGIECPLPMKNIYGTEAFLHKILLEEKRYELNNTAVMDGSHSYTDNIVRLLVFVEGDIIKSVPYSPDLLINLGKTVGKLQRLLKDFEHHSMQTYVTLWNMEYFPQILKYLYVVRDQKDRALISDIVQSFQQHVLPALDQLKNGIIHGDASEHNTIVRKKVGKSDQYGIAGLIDFETMTESYYIFEIGTTIMYMMLDSEAVPCMEVGGYILAGYLKEMKLSDLELDLIYYCVAARYATSLVMGVHAYSLDPSNDYILVAAERGWPQLRQYWATPKSQVNAAWSKIIKLYN